MRARAQSHMVQVLPGGVPSPGPQQDALGWLDATCFAAKSAEQVSACCREHPEWYLRCEPFDGSDADLAALHALLLASSAPVALQASLVRECARVAISRILRGEPHFTGAQLVDCGDDESDDLGIVELHAGAPLLIMQRHGVRSTQAASLGVLTHDRMVSMAQGAGRPDRCLLILPDLELHRPMAMTQRVVIANLSPRVLRDGMVRFAEL